MKELALITTLPFANSPLDRAIELAPGLEGALRAGQLLWALNAIERRESLWSAVARDMQVSRACARRVGRNPSWGHLTTLGELLGVCRAIDTFGPRVPRLDEAALHALSETLVGCDLAGNRDRLNRYVVNTSVEKGWAMTMRYMRQIDTLAMIRIEIYWSMVESTVEKVAPWDADVARVANHWLSSQRLDELLWAAFRLERLIGDFSREQVGARARIRGRAPLFRPFEARDGKIVVRAIPPGAPELGGVRRDLGLAWEPPGFGALYVECCSSDSRRKAVGAFFLNMDGTFQRAAQYPRESDTFFVAALDELAARLDNDDLEFNAATRRAFAEEALVMAHAHFLRREGFSAFAPKYEQEVLEILPGYGAMRRRITNAVRRAIH